MANGISETFYEWCPDCRDEQELKIVNGKRNKLFKCPECGRALAPCSLCDPDNAECYKCKLNKESQRINYSKQRRYDRK